MAQVKVTVTDDEGKVSGVHDYRLDEQLNTLSKMESSLEQLRPQMLSEITQDLLEQEQRTFQFIVENSVTLVRLSQVGLFFALSLMVKK